MGTIPKGTPTQPFELAGAYGRRYATLQQVRDDWDAGLDFVIVGAPRGYSSGRYCSKRDAHLMGRVVFHFLPERITLTLHT